MQLHGKPNSASQEERNKICCFAKYLDKVVNLLVYVTVITASFLALALRLPKILQGSIFLTAYQTLVMNAPS